MALAFSGSRCACSPPPLVPSQQLEVETIALPLCWPLLEVLLGEIVKAFEGKREARDQKFAKLDFGTKLGMHSPL